MPTKTLSIITINKNNAAGLEKTIGSVVGQTSIDFEYIVIDGASNDESVAVIKKYADRIDYWISEPDEGIYNAMNKGIQKAQGNYCLFLNSGDWLVSPETLADVIKEIEGNTADIFYGNRINSDDSFVSYPQVLDISFLIRKPISHQNALIKRSLFFEHGLYNEELKICSDWEFFLQELWKYKSLFCHVKTNISVFDINGVGSQAVEKREAENIIVFKNVFNGLADIIIEYKKFHKTIYYDIVKNNYDSKFLSFWVKVYRKIIKIRGSI